MARERALRELAAGLTERLTARDLTPNEPAPRLGAGLTARELAARLDAGLPPRERRLRQLRAWLNAGLTARGLCGGLDEYGSRGVGRGLTVRVLRGLDRVLRGLM